MVKVEKLNYARWKNCYRVTNSIVDLIATSDIGPRIIFFGFSGKENQFYENKKELGLTGGNEFHLYGGHRLWHAPETPDRTFFPDNQPVKVEILPDGLLLTAPIEATTGIQKIIELHMSTDKPLVVLNHTLKNHGLWPVPLAPWAVTILKPGGVAVLPHPPRIHWPELLPPSHTITLWGYTGMSDHRFTWGDKYILLRQDSKEPLPQKVGMLNTSGWAAYARAGFLFLKKFDIPTTGKYPDLNTNLECWSNQELLELETLAPLELLEPGNSLSHRENWYLAQNVPQPANDVDVDQNVLPVVGLFRLSKL